LKHYLFVYDHRKARILKPQKFDDGRIALRRRFSLERNCDGIGDVEVVALGTHSTDQLKPTHRGARTG